MARGDPDGLAVALYSDPPPCRQRLHHLEPKTALIVGKVSGYLLPCRSIRTSIRTSSPLRSFRQL